MGQAVYQKYFFSQQIWQAVYQKCFFFTTDVTSCVSKGATECLSCWSRGRLQQGHCLPHYICFLLVLHISSTFFFCLSWSIQWLIIKIICDHHVHDYQWLSAWYRLERLSLNQRRILGTNFPIWDHPPLWGYWGYWRYWEPTFQFGIIILFEDIEDIGNQLLNFGSSTPLRILRITRILRILRTLGTNFPILDHSPHWGIPSLT